MGRSKRHVQKIIRPPKGGHGWLTTMVRQIFGACRLPSQHGIRRHTSSRSILPSVAKTTPPVNQSFRHVQIQPNPLSVNVRKVCDGILSRSHPLRNPSPFEFRRIPPLPESSNFGSPPLDVGFTQRKLLCSISFVRSSLSVDRGGAMLTFSIRL